MDLSNSVSDEIATMFLATSLSFGEAAPEDTELLTLRKLPFEDAYHMVLRGEIRDSMSVTAILHVKLLMLQGEV
jgi:ADP-ribose pyrophosphatase